jgi:hypothetical protein
VSQLEIVPEASFEDGLAEGKKLGREAVLKQTADALADQHLRDSLGAMSRDELARYAMMRLETPPDYVRYPELEDIYPERLDLIRGFAKGAECSLEEAAVCRYVTYRREIESWYWSLQLEREPAHCSGVMFHGPDGVIGGQSVESSPPPMPKSYRWRAPKPYRGLKQLKTSRPKLVLRKPRTGYIESWGVGNEKGVACFASVSCSVWLDEPIEDTWPVGAVPLLRFAADVRQLADLYTRYTLHNWSRANQIWADVSGNAVVVEKCFRRIGFRWIGHDRTLWCTEGHYESPEMQAYMRSKRLEYVRKAGKHLGAEDLQYATDCHVRFTRLAELCHEPWGRGYEHIRRVLTDHAPFPRAVCRHGGPDTAPYDRSVTMGSGFSDLTHNRSLRRDWLPWKRFCCERPEAVTLYPPRPR